MSGNHDSFEIQEDGLGMKPNQLKIPLMQGTNQLERKDSSKHMLRISNNPQSSIFKRNDSFGVGS
jgi:hypothetical protein